MFYDLTARRNHNYLAGNATKVFIHNTVLHAYLGEQITGDQAKLLVKKVMTHYSLPYLSITSTFSICPRHGYIPGEHPLCPKCIAEKQALEDALKKLKGDSK
jgi:ribonucleoside-triphosphate reductase